MEKNYKLHSVLIPKNNEFDSLDKAINWIKENDFKVKKKVDITNDYYRFRQLNPQYLIRTGYSEFRSKRLPNGVLLVIAYKK
jgi:hypothetical protein